MKIVIIGGSAAGASAAAKARRTDESAQIIILEQGAYVSFANCGLPYYVGGTIPERDDLLLVTPELFKARFNVDVRTLHRVTQIDAQAKTVKGENPGGPFEESYDRLVIAIGGEPVMPRIPGADLPGVSTVFSIPDVDRIMDCLKAGAKRAAVIGGGFIGIETADELAGRGIETTLVEAAPQILSNFDREFGVTAVKELEKRGVKVILNASVTEIKGGGRVEKAVLDDGTEIDADMVIMAAGIRPRVKLAREAGCDIGPAGGIVTDAGMRTNLPGVYAAGDNVEVVSLVSGRKIRNPLGASANRQGRIAGANAAGDRMTFRGATGSSIIKVGDIAIAKTGLTERECVAEELSYDVIFLPGNTNAGYYPTADTLILKLIFEVPTGRILGATGAARKSIEKDIDILSTAIMGGLTVFDLEHLDLCYAPPFGSAKEPCVLLGMVASNVLRGQERVITPMEAVLHAEHDPDTVILDVRTKEEYDWGHLPGAVLIPVDELRGRLDELDRSKHYLVNCRIGARAWTACNILAHNGFDVQNVTGGWVAYTMDLDE